MAEEWGREQIIARIRAEALKQGVDPDLAVAVATQESYLNPNARGDNGKSLGLFQLQPGAATDAGISPTLRHVPALNIQGGVRYLKLKLDQSKGNVDQALSRYNRGTPDYRGIGDPNYVQNVKQFYTPTAGESQPRTAGSAQPPAAKPWWDKFVPRLGPRSAEAAEGPAKKWYDDIVPDTQPTAAPTSPPPPAAQSMPAAPAATAQQGKWYDVVPDVQPGSPPAAPSGAPAQPPLPIQPPAGSEAPAPTWKLGLGDPEGTATAEEAQGAVEQLRQRQAQPAAEATPPASPPNPMQQGIADIYTPDPQAASRMLNERSPMPPPSEITRELAATGIETLAGVEGAIAGGVLGNVPGMIGGGIAGQSYGRRLTNRLGLREQEEPLATGFGLSLYPSDVANAGFGLLTGGPALFKAALAKTTAGKAIVSAEMSTKEAYLAWQAKRQELQAAQKTGQQAELNTALKDHATAEANYKRLVGERNDTIAANKAEYNQAVKDYGEGARLTHIDDLTAQQKYLDDLAEAQRKQYGAVRAETERELLASREAGYTKTLDQIKKEQGTYETQVAGETQALESQAAAIPEARAIPEPYAQGTPSHVLYKDMRDRYSNEPLTLTQGQADLKDLRANRPKTLTGTSSPFEGEVETIAQGLEKSTGANVATIHEQLKKLGPLTRHSDGKIRGDAKQLSGILMDVLETAPEAAGAIKAANQRFKREMALEDMHDWLKPGHGVLGTRRGKDTINPDAFLRKFQKERADSKLFRDSFTEEEAATIEENMRALAAKTLPAPPLKAPVPPTPELLPGSSPPPPVTGEALPAAAYNERFTKGLGGMPEPTKLPPPPEMAAPPKEVKPVPPLTVPLEPPAKIPPEPASTSTWYPEPRNKGEWLRKAPPKEGQWSREQWETYAQEKLGKKPGFSIQGLLSGAGGMAFALQRMGMSPAGADKALFAVVGSGLAGGFGKQSEWLLSRALLSDRYRPLLQEAMMDKATINPYFYNAMLAALTPEDRKEYDRMQRSTQQKARR